MKAKILVFLICVEAITYLLSYNLHDCAFNFSSLDHKPTKNILQENNSESYYTKKKTVDIQSLIKSRNNNDAKIITSIKKTSKPS